MEVKAHSSFRTFLLMLSEKQRKEFLVLQVCLGFQEVIQIPQTFNWSKEQRAQHLKKTKPAFLNQAHNILYHMGLTMCSEIGDMADPHLLSIKEM